MNKIEGYKTSKDYELLFQLMQKSSIICIIDARDIAQAIYSNESYRIFAKATNYVWEENKDHFIRECVKYNVEFIEPTEMI
jgi:hypothetical protein